jgi:hypothetical protein
MVDNVVMHKFTPFEAEVIESLLWQHEGYWKGRVSERATKRIMRASLRRIKSPVIACSKMSRRNGVEVQRDHAVPLNVIVEKILARRNWSNRGLTGLLNRTMVYVLLTRDEHVRQLTCTGLNRKMPSDWDGKDVFVRYSKANIQLVKPYD